MCIISIWLIVDTGFSFIVVYEFWRLSEVMAILVSIQLCLLLEQVQQQQLYKWASILSPPGVVVDWWLRVNQISCGLHSWYDLEDGRLKSRLVPGNAREHLSPILLSMRPVRRIYTFDIRHVCVIEHLFVAYKCETNGIGERATKTQFIPSRRALWHLKLILVCWRWSIFTSVEWTLPTNSIIMMTILVLTVTVSDHLESMDP